jgi:hypothetical protein
MCKVKIEEVIMESDRFICCRIEAAYEPFVTWKKDVKGGYQIGHYFSKEEEAIADYEERVKYQ